MNIEAYDIIIEEAKDLALRKNNDYSGNKIDNISLTGVNGISVRLLDKVSRAYNLSSGTNQQVKTESLRDTFIDIVNYAVFAIMMIDNQWTNKNMETANGKERATAEHTQDT